MENKKIDKKTIREYYLELVENPKFIEKLDNYEKQAMINYANVEIKEAEYRIRQIKMLNPHLNYDERLNLDETFKNGKFINELIKNSELSKQPLLKTENKKYPAKCYALYHCILIALGKENNFPSTFTKSDKIKFAEKKYKCNGDSFQREFRDIDLTKTYTFVKNMNQKYRNSWKNIITDISNNDSDIIEWLNRQPN
jgi:hypothetical protein